MNKYTEFLIENYKKDYGCASNMQKLIAMQNDILSIRAYDNYQLRTKNLILELLEKMQADLEVE